MEEILASIRRIISDEDQPAPEDAEATGEEFAAEAADAEMSEADLDQLFGESDEPAIPEGDADAGSESEPAFEPVADDGFDAAPEADVLELSEEQAVDDSPKIIESADGLDFVEPEPEPIVARNPEEDMVGGFDAAPSPEPAVFDYDEAPVSEDKLLSTETDNAVSLSFQDLATTILSNNARTLEDLVREMLRPMLKSWLDENLPSLVERLVRAEIERVSRGGRN